MELIGGLGLAGLAVYFVLRPLFDHDRVGRRSSADTDLEALFAEREALHRALKELDLDREMGRLSAEEHQAQRRAYLLRVASLLQEIDERSAGAEQSATAEVEARCAHCAYPRRAEDRYCPQCGAPLQKPA